jgi:hypothetical protein
MGAAMTVFLCGLVVGADGIGGPNPELVTPDRSACVWTGKEMLVWNGGPHVGAFDPTQNTWRVVKPALPSGRIVSQGFLRLSDGTILAVYWNIAEKNRLCFDRCWPQEGRWRRLAAVDGTNFKDAEGKPYDATMSDGRQTWFALDVLGMAPLSDGAVVFVDTSDDPITGVHVDYDGRTKWISRKNAPCNCGDWRDTAVYSQGDKVLCFTYAFVDLNQSSVWNAKSDTWSKPKGCARRYDFSHCQLGDEIYVFGGAESSAFGWIKKDGEVYSFSKNQWRPLPMKNGPQGCRGGVMCSTGDRILVWGGDSISLADYHVVGAKGHVKFETSAKPLSSALLSFDPAKQEWRAIEGIAAPTPRWNSPVVWTGKEMIVWAGRSHSMLGPPLSNGIAFDPATGRWRNLPDLPKGILIETLSKGSRTGSLSSN